MRINLYLDNKIFKKDNKLMLICRDKTMKYLCEECSFINFAVSKDNIIQVEVNEGSDPFYMGTTLASHSSTFFNLKHLVERLNKAPNEKSIFTSVSVETHIVNKDIEIYDNKCSKIDNEWKLEHDVED